MNLDAGIASAEGGLDMAMPNGGFFWGVGGSNLTTFVRNGSLPEARINDSTYTRSDYSQNALTNFSCQWPLESLQHGTSWVKM